MIHPAVIAVVITKNEQRHLADCLKSLTWAGATVVFDSFSTDSTEQVARQAGAQWVQHPFENFAAQRNAALDYVRIQPQLASAEWVFFVDADERIPADLAAEIAQVITQPNIAGWWVPRHNWIVGKVILGAGWYPDYQLRLLRLDHAHYDPIRPVHEVVILDGPDAHLQHPLDHVNYETWAEFNQKQIDYAQYEARILHDRGIRPRPHNFVLQPLREFKRRYITLQGWRAGGHGLRLSLAMARATYLSYQFLAKM